MTKRVRTAAASSAEQIEAQALYVIEGLSIRAIAERMAGRKGCSARQLQRRYEREGWKEKRQKHVENVAALSSEKAAETAASIRVRHMQAYGFFSRVSTANAAVLAKRMQTGITKADAESFKHFAVIMDIAAKGERSVVDTRDDRVSDIFAAAGRMAEGNIEQIEDWNADEEANQAMQTKAMSDLSFGGHSGTPVDNALETHEAGAEDEE